MSNKVYTSIPAPKVARNAFNRSRSNTFSMVFHRCVPTVFEEILPGDLFRVSSELFSRLQPMVAPVFNQMKISQHSFFVPLRTLNRHFAEFMFNNRMGNYTDVLPYCTLADCYAVAISSNVPNDDRVEMIRLFDYMGLPFKYRSATTQATFLSNWQSDNSWASNSTLRVNICPFLAYTKVWSEYFRDQNTQEDPFERMIVLTSIDVQTLTGAFMTNWSAANKRYFFRLFCILRMRSWAHDRFTSALPWAQRGPDVLLPVSGTLNVDWNVDPLSNGANVQAKGNPDRLYTLDAGGQEQAVTGEVDLSSGLSTTINEFRRAERLQRWYENSARGGTRPNEATLAHWGIRTPDATLDRAEFLGGSMQPVVVSDVEQTSETTQSSPLGTLGGKATSYKPGRLCKAFFTEHGFLIILTSALCRANYSQGLPKMFSRMQRDEYAWPEFANLGEEPVFTKEIDAVHSSEDDVFGYVPRYSDYKSATNEVHGDFKTSLAFWTQIREFANQPQLNEQFLFSNPSLAPFAVSNPYTDLILCTATYSIQASRLLPFYGVPTI